MFKCSGCGVQLQDIEKELTYKGKIISEKKIYKKIKEYDNIVIARHIGVDPDAWASQVALRDAIKATFPNKSVYAVGNSSSKFNYLNDDDDDSDDIIPSFLRKRGSF